MPKKIIQKYNPTNLSVFNDITDDESAYLARLKEIFRSIDTGVDRVVIGGNYQHLLLLAQGDVRDQWITDRLVTVATSGASSKSDKTEAENLLVALGYCKLHRC